MRKTLSALALIIFSLTAFSATNMYAPTLVAPANAAAGQQVSLLLDWSAVPGAISYKVEYSTDSTFASSFVITGPTTAATISDLMFGTEYSWRVKAYGPSDSSAWSSVFTFTTIDKVTVSKPIDSTYNHYTTLGLQWTHIIGATAYELEADTVNTFDSPLFTSKSFGIASSGVSHQLKFGRSYYLRMRAMDAADTSAWSDMLQIWTIDTLVLKKPANDSLNTFSNVSIQWKYNGAKDYELSIATDSAFTTEVIYPVDSTNIVFTSTDTLVTVKEDLDFNTTYFFKVRGTNTWGASRWSEVRKFTTLNCIALRIPADSAVGITTLPIFKWEIAGTDTTEMQLDTSSVFSNPFIVKTADTVSRYTITSELLPHTMYYWRVRGIHTTDTTSWCNGRVFTTNGGAGIVQIPVSLNNISIYPNPSKNGNVFVQVNSNMEQEITIVVSNLFGQDIYNEKHPIGQGQNTIKINLDNSGNGIYLIKVINAGNTITRKIVLDK